LTSNHLAVDLLS